MSVKPQLETGTGSEDDVFELVRELESKALEYLRVDTSRVFLVPQGNAGDVDVSDLKSRLLDERRFEDGTIFIGGGER